MTIGVGFIKGVMLGIEYFKDDDCNMLQVDLFIIRLCFINGDYEGQ